VFYKNPPKRGIIKLVNTVPRMRDYFTPWRVIMTPDQELYAKALEIAVLILGELTLTTNMSMSDFQQKIGHHHELALKIAQKILNAPKLIRE
jgi:hypothetical protein